MAKKTGKKTGKLDLFPIINGIIMVLFIVITLYPVLNTLAISLNDGTDALRGGIYLLPRKFTWKNYITVLQKDNLITGAYITVARTIIGTLLALVANAILAFIVSRKRFLFKKELSLFWVITMYVNGGMIPTFLLYKQLGLTNSFGVYVIPGMVSAFNMLVNRYSIFDRTIEQNGLKKTANFIRNYGMPNKELLLPKWSTSRFGKVRAVRKKTQLLPKWFGMKLSPDVPSCPQTIVTPKRNR